MARYRLKRKTFGVGDAISNTVGGVAQTVGNVADTKIGGLAGGLGAASLASKIGFLGGGPIGMAIGGLLGAAATRGVGKGLKSMGESMTTQ